MENHSEIDVLWVTAGLGCDGDTIAITAATQPSIEEIVMGAIPGIPKGGVTMGDQETSGPAPSLGVRKGEEIARDEGKEGGRQETGSSHADRPAGTKTARDSTAINPEDEESKTEGKTMPPA